MQKKNLSTTRERPHYIDLNRAAKCLAMTGEREREHECKRLNVV